MMGTGLGFSYDIWWEPWESTEQCAAGEPINELKAAKLILLHHMVQLDYVNMKH